MSSASVCVYESKKSLYTLVSELFTKKYMIEYISKVNIDEFYERKKKTLGHMCRLQKRMSCDNVIYRQNFFGNKEPTARNTEMGIMHESCYQDRGKTLIERFKRKQQIRTRANIGFDTGLIKGEVEREEME